MVAASTLPCSSSGATSPYTCAVMLHAFADGEDARVGGLHVVVDHDAAIHFDAGLAPKFHIGPDAGGDHHHVGLDRLAVRERDALDVPLPSSRWVTCAGQHADAQLFHLLLQVRALPSGRAGCS